MLQASNDVRDPSFQEQPEGKHELVHINMVPSFLVFLFWSGILDYGL